MEGKLRIKSTTAILRLSSPRIPLSDFPIYTLRDLVVCLSDEHLGREQENTRVPALPRTLRWGYHHYTLRPSDPLPS